MGMVSCSKEDSTGTNTNNSPATNGNNNGGGVAGNYATLIGGKWILVSIDQPDGNIPIPSNQADIFEFYPGDDEITTGPGETFKVNGTVSITAHDQNGQPQTNSCYYVLNGNHLELIGPICPTMTIKKLNTTNLDLEQTQDNTTVTLHFQRVNS